MVFLPENFLVMNFDSDAVAYACQDYGKNMEPSAMIP